MNYIYDVLLNFNKEYFDFYEWEETDDVYQIRKVPIIKVSKKKFLDIKNNLVKFDENFLKNISNKAERFKINNIIKIKYAFILVCEEDALGIKLNKDGLNVFKSSLLIDEKEDVVKMLQFNKEFDLNYEIIKENKVDNFKTRFELENERFINDELDKIYDKKNYSKLSYLYLECFNVSEPDIDKAYNKLKKELNSNFHKIYDFFKITNR